MKRLSSVALIAAAVFGGSQTSHAAFLTNAAHLDGRTEPSPSLGSGDTIVDYDSVAHTLRVRTTFTGLTSGTNASHIHAATHAPGTGTAGVATQVPTFASFPLGVTSGSMDQTLDLTQLG